MKCSHGVPAAEECNSCLLASRDAWRAAAREVADRVADYVGEAEQASPSLSRLDVALARVKALEGKEAPAPPPEWSREQVLDLAEVARDAREYLRGHGVSNEEDLEDALAPFLAALRAREGGKK